MLQIIIIVFKYVLEKLKDFNNLCSAFKTSLWSYVKLMLSFSTNSLLLTEGRELLGTAY